MTKKTDQQWIAEAAAFDREFCIDDTRPLTPAERALWNQVQTGEKKHGESNGQKPATVRVQPPLVQQLTALAKKRKVSRARLVNDLLTEAMDRLAQK